MYTPACDQAHWTSPEQSKPTPASSPPQTYGTPSWDSAAWTAAIPPVSPDDEPDTGPA